MLVDDGLHVGVVAEGGDVGGVDNAGFGAEGVGEVVGAAVAPDMLHVGAQMGPDAVHLALTELGGGGRHASAPRAGPVSGTLARVEIGAVDTEAHGRVGSGPGVLVGRGSNHGGVGGAMLVG